MELFTKYLSGPKDFTLINNPKTDNHIARLRDFLVNRNKLTSQGLLPIKRVLLVGPAGTGKKSIVENLSMSADLITSITFPRENVTEDYTTQLRSVGFSPGNLVIFEDVTVNWLKENLSLLTTKLNSNPIKVFIVHGDADQTIKDLNNSSLLYKFDYVIPTYNPGRGDIAALISSRLEKYSPEAFERQYDILSDCIDELVGLNHSKIVNICEQARTYCYLKHTPEHIVSVFKATIDHFKSLLNKEN